MQLLKKRTGFAWEFAGKHDGNRESTDELTPKEINIRLGKLLSGDFNTVTDHPQAFSSANPHPEGRDQFKSSVPLPTNEELVGQGLPVPPLLIQQIEESTSKSPVPKIVTEPKDLSRKTSKRPLTEEIAAAVKRM